LKELEELLLFGIDIMLVPKLDVKKKNYQEVMEIQFHLIKFSLNLIKQLLDILNIYMVLKIILKKAIIAIKEN